MAHPLVAAADQRGAGTPVMAELTVPAAGSHGARAIYRQGAHTTISNTPYAAVTDVKSSLASPHTPSLVCDCGTATPDGCLPTQQLATTPYVSSALTRSYMMAAADSEPYMSLPAQTHGPSVDGVHTHGSSADRVQRYLRDRAAPMQ